MSRTDTSSRLHRDDAHAFDFRHPSTLSRDDARALQLLQETLAHGVATTLASAVRASIDVQIARIDQTPHGEFVRRTPDPSSLSLLRLGGLGTSAVLQVDSTLSFALVELLMGGPGTGPHPARAHTEIEEALIGGLVGRFRPSIDDAFAPITPVETELVGHESNPAFVQIASTTDMVVSIGLDVGVDDVRGCVRLVLPVSVLRPHLDELSTEPAEAPRNELEVERTRSIVSDQLGHADVVARVRFDPLVTSSRELLELAVGDVVALDHGLEVPLVFEIHGVPIHEVTIGRVKRSLAVNVVGPAPSRRQRPSRLRHVSATDDGI